MSNKLDEIENFCKNVTLTKRELESIIFTQYDKLNNREKVSELFGISENTLDRHRMNGEKRIEKTELTYVCSKTGKKFALPLSSYETNSFCSSPIEKQIILKDFTSKELGLESVSEEKPVFYSWSESIEMNKNKQNINTDIIKAESLKELYSILDIENKLILLKLHPEIITNNIKNNILSEVKDLEKLRLYEFIENDMLPSFILKEIMYNEQIYEAKNEENELINLSNFINNNDLTAICGKIGSGKSTIIHTICLEMLNNSKYNFKPVILDPLDSYKYQLSQLFTISENINSDSDVIFPKLNVNGDMTTKQIKNILEKIAMNNVNTDELLLIIEQFHYLKDEDIQDLINEIQCKYKNVNIILVSQTHNELQEYADNWIFLKYNSKVPFINKNVSELELNKNNLNFVISDNSNNEEKIMFSLPDIMESFINMKEANIKKYNISY